MKLACHLTNAARMRRAGVCVVGLVALLSTGLVLPLGSAEAATTVPLGTAEDFAVLAGSTITNTGQTVITGDVGLHPGSAVTGFGPGADAVTQDGSLHVADGVALQAKNDLTTAYTNAAGQTTATEVPTQLGGSTLTAGIYDSAAGTFQVTGPLTLDGEGDPRAVFIFQMGSTLTTASASTVNLVNGADACNVFWQVGSSATLGTNSTFRGTILANTSATLTTGAVVEGRVLAREGAVTMDTNTITATTCDAAVDEPTPVEPAPVEPTPVEPAPVEPTPVDPTPVEPTPVDEGTPVTAPTPVEPAPVNEPSPVDAPAPVAAPAPVDEASPDIVAAPPETATPTPTPSVVARAPGDDTSTQITRVPVGSVPAGGGDTGDGGLPLLVLVGLAMAVASALGLTAARRLRA